MVWLHGASVGEGLSLVPLAARIRDLRPDVNLVVTTGTRAAAEVVAPQLPAGAFHQFVPIDTPSAARRFIGHWRPDLGVFVESELWPNLIEAARNSGARLALVSAKLSQGSLRNWSRFPRAARAVLGAFDLIFARDPLSASHFEALGARVDGIWDAKLGAAPLPVAETELLRLRAEFHGHALILATSTHPGEEAQIARAFASAAADFPSARLVIAPRHPARGAEVARVVTAEGLSAGRRSQGAGHGERRALIADTMGELGLWYRLATLAIVGGSLMDGLSGHNPLEPARLGCPFVAGVHVGHWPIYGQFVDADATRLVGGSDDLAVAMRQAFTHSEMFTEMAVRAMALVRRLDAQSQALAPSLVTLLEK